MDNYEQLFLAGLINEAKSSEKTEEKSGIDFDKDKEMSEPQAHKTKVKRSLAKNLDFITKRRAGAAKIATSAKLKGGPAILTYYHFAAKDAQYQEVLDAMKTGKDEKWFKNQYKLAMKKLHGVNFQQKLFQQASGELEVWGEAISQLF